MERKMKGGYGVIHHIDGRDSVYWWEMIGFRVCLFVLCFLAIFPVFGLAQENMSTGVLEPGNSYKGIDELVIDAVKAQLDKTLMVYIERIEDTSDLLELSQNPNSPLKAETAYYRIGATEKFTTDGTFLIYVPLPEGAPTKDLAVFTLSINDGSLPPLPLPDGTTAEEGPSISWSSFPVTYIPERNAIVFGRRGIGPKGSIFTIVSGRYNRTK